MFEKIRYNLIFELRCVQPVAFIQNTNQRLPAELEDKRRQKIHVIPPLGVFRIKHTDQHVGFGDDLLENRDVFSKSRAVGVRGIDQQYMLESVGGRG